MKQNHTHKKIKPNQTKDQQPANCSFLSISQYVFLMSMQHVTWPLCWSNDFLLPRDVFQDTWSKTKTNWMTLILPETSRQISRYLGEQMIFFLVGLFCLVKKITSVSRILAEMETKFLYLCKENITKLDTSILKYCECKSNMCETSGRYSSNPCKHISPAHSKTH